MNDRNSRFIYSKSPDNVRAEVNVKILRNMNFIDRVWIKIKRKITLCVYLLMSFLLMTNNKNKKLNPEEVKKVLISRWDLLGDMVLTLPVIDYLKRINPSVEIDIIVSKNNKGLVVNDLRINRIIEINNYIDFLTNFFILFNIKYDLFLSFMDINVNKEILFANLFAFRSFKASVRRKIKYKPYFSGFIKNKVGSGHISERFLEVAKLGINSNISDANFFIYIPIKNKTKISEFINKNILESFMVVNVSAGAKFREWGLDNYISFFGSAEFNKLRYKVVLISKPEDSAIINKLADIYPFLVVFPKTNDILDICELINNCDIVFTPDTSIVHIAVALNKPIVCLYTLIMTNPNEWIPKNVLFRAILSDGFEPISSIPVAKVIQGFSDVVEEINRNSTS